MSNVQTHAHQQVYGCSHLTRQSHTGLTLVLSLACVDAEATVGQNGTPWAYSEGGAQTLIGAQGKHQGLHTLVPWSVRLTLNHGPMPLPQPMLTGHRNGL